MTITNLKKLASAFDVPHGTSTTAGHECLRCVCEAARMEVEMLEKAAKDLTRLHLSDGTDDVAHRDHVIQVMTDDPASQWSHPDVVAWAEASQLLAAIAKESK